MQDLDSLPSALSWALQMTRESPHEFVCRIYEAERDTVYRYLVSLSLEPGTAQDLTQEAFLRLYIHIRKGQEIRAVRAWLIAVASNLAITLHRDRVAQSPLNDQGDRLPQELADPAANPEAMFLAREQFLAFRRAFLNLSRQQQICLHLRSEGLRYRDIAEALGIAVPTVAEFVRRGIIRLKKVLHGS